MSLAAPQTASQPVAAPRAAPEHAALPPARKKRVEFIDLTRGLLFTLMTSSHALALSRIAPEHFFNSIWWLPRFWATLCFIMLSGFSIGYLFDWHEKAAASGAKMRRRAGQILVVMFVSNIVMLILGMAGDRDFSALASPRWWLGLLTFETHYSISAILIPTGLLLLISPWTAAGLRRWGAGGLLALALVVSLAEAAASHVLKAQGVNQWFIRHFITVGIGDFEVVHLIIFGVIGFALGGLWRAGTPRQRTAALAVGIAVMILFRYLWTPHPQADSHIVMHAIEGPAYFLTVLAFALWAAARPALAHPTSFFRLIGKYALFSFLAHRIVLQVLYLALRAVGGTRLAPELIYAICFPGTMLIIWTLCLAREPAGRIDQALKRIWI